MDIFLGGHRSARYTILCWNSHPCNCTFVHIERFLLKVCFRSFQTWSLAGLFLFLLFLLFFTYVLFPHVLVIFNCVWDTMFAQLFTYIILSQCYPILEGIYICSASAWSISSLEASCFSFRDWDGFKISRSPLQEPVSFLFSLPARVQLFGDPNPKPVVHSGPFPTTLSQLWIQISIPQLLKASVEGKQVQHAIWTSLSSSSLDSPSTPPQYAHTIVGLWMFLNIY